MLGLLGIAVLFSTNRRAIRLRTVLGALGLQVGFGVIVLYWSVGQRALEAASTGVQAVIDSSREGIGFLFGPVLPAEGQGQVFAFQVLPVIVFFASLTAVLYHLGILQRVVAVLGGGLGWLLGTERAESVNAAANVFVGQTEAPLVIRPYVAGLSRSGLFAVMVGGLSTVAGSVLVGYSLLGARLDYLIAASFMAAPGALLMAKIILPEDATPDGAAPAADEVADERQRATGSDDGDSSPDAPDAVRARNVIDAAANGAADGLRLAATIGAMLLAFISLIALANLLVGGVGGWFGAEDLTVEQMLGWLFAPVMAMVGVPVERGDRRRQLPGAEGRAQRVRRLLQPRPGPRRLQRQERRHRHLRAHRLRQPRLPRHPARRARRHRPRAASRHRLPRPARHPGRHPREPDERRHRRRPHRLTPASDGRFHAPRAVGYPRRVAHEQRAPVAQRIEHLTTDQKVWGSNPYRRTTHRSRRSVR